MFRDLDKCEAAQGGSKPPNWENRPERFMLLKKPCDYTLFQLKKEKRKKKKETTTTIREKNSTG